LPKKMILGALRSALSAKVEQQKLTIVEDWTLGSHKTKAFRLSLDKLDGATKTILLVENAPDANLERASRNLDGVTLVPTSRLEAYDLMRHDRLMLSRETAIRLGRTLSSVKGPSEAPVQIEPAPAAPAKAAASEARAEKSAKTKAAPKAAKKAAPAKAAKKEKPAAKPKAKKE
jgi:large subunit ribosomal protein L4